MTWRKCFIEWYERRMGDKLPVIQYLHNKSQEGDK
jgi:hypothetical protein